MDLGKLFSTPNMITKDICHMLAQNSKQSTTDVFYNHVINLSLQRIKFPQVSEKTGLVGLPSFKGL